MFAEGICFLLHILRVPIANDSAAWDPGWSRLIQLLWISSSSSSVRTSCVSPLHVLLPVLLEPQAAISLLPSQVS